jgi:hypothetical protein
MDLTGLAAGRGPAWITGAPPQLGVAQKGLNLMSGLPWFRFYSEALNDPKLRRIGRQRVFSVQRIMGRWAELWRRRC